MKVQVQEVLPLILQDLKMREVLNINRPIERIALM